MSDNQNNLHDIDQNSESQNISAGPIVSKEFLNSSLVISRNFRTDENPFRLRSNDSFISRIQDADGIALDDRQSNIIENFLKVDFYPNDPQQVRLGKAFVDRGQIEIIRRLLDDVERSSIYVKDRPIISKEQINSSDSPLIIQSSYQSVPTISVSSLGTLLSMLFFGLMAIGFPLKVRLIDPLVGILAIVFSLSFVIMGVSAKKGWKH